MPHPCRYKARFNWEHYTHVLAPGAKESLPEETQACASVTSAFLQVRRRTRPAHEKHVSGTG
jgi:hypothetical protein